MASAPIDVSTATSPRTLPPYRSSRKSPTVRWPRAEAIAHSFGPTQKASASVPRPTAPFHHQALMPSRYATPAAPTVVPAPMLAASTVAPTSGHVRRRPATKKSAGTLTRRPIHTPKAVRATV